MLPEEILRIEIVAEAESSKVYGLPSAAVHRRALFCIDDPMRRDRALGGESRHKHKGRWIVRWRPPAPGAARLVNVASEN